MLIHLAFTGKASCRLSDMLGKIAQQTSVLPWSRARVSVDFLLHDLEPLALRLHENASSLSSCSPCLRFLFL